MVAVGQFAEYGQQLSYIAHGDDFSKSRILTVVDFASLQTVIGTLTTSIASSISLEGMSNRMGGNSSCEMCLWLTRLFLQAQRGTAIRTRLLI